MTLEQRISLLSHVAHRAAIVAREWERDGELWTPDADAMLRSACRQMDELFHALDLASGETLGASSDGASIFDADTDEMTMRAEIDAHLDAAMEQATDEVLIGEDLLLVAPKTWGEVAELEF